MLTADQIHCTYITYDIPVANITYADDHIIVSVFGQLPAIQLALLTSLPGFTAISVNLSNHLELIYQIERS